MTAAPQQRIAKRGYKVDSATNSILQLRWLKSSTDPVCMDSRLRTLTTVNLAAVMERLDEQTLPALYSAVSAAFQTTPAQLGYLTLCRALVQAMASPAGGIAGLAALRP